jgi:four helix bundle protein
MNREKKDSEKPQDLKSRTLAYGLSIIKLYSLLPKSEVALVIGKQFLKSGTSAGAHYRESIRSRSDAEFISKIEGGLQELEETAYWLELLGGARIISDESIRSLLSETDELIAIFTTCVKNVRQRKDS